jgi:hypothetical protein
MAEDGCAEGAARPHGQDVAVFYGDMQSETLALPGEARR